MERRTASLDRGEQVGRYIVLHTLGEGGMGIVYAAYDPQLDRRVALKVVRAEHRTDRGRSIARGRLAREAQALAKLSHRNVVTVYDVGAHGEDLFVAMELVDGLTLSDWLATPRPWPEVLALLLEAGQGLAAAHHVGVVHRDFKPSNVLVSSRGDVRVTDFGLARLEATTEVVAIVELEESASARVPAELTRTGKVVGTPAYMAPEQHAGHAPDARADQYAFALTLYEALYGARPFGDLGGIALGAAKLVGIERIPTSDVTSHRVPWRIRRALSRALAPDPKQRFASMQQLLDALGRAARARSRWPVIAAALGVAALAVGLERMHADAENPTDVVQPSEDAAAAVLRQRIEEVRTRAAAGQYGQAIPEAHIVVQQARELDDDAVLADALLAKAEVHDDLGETDHALQALRDAAAAARSSGHGRAEAKALIELGHVLTVRKQESARAEFYLDRAESLLSTIADAPDLEARLALARGRLAFVQGRDEDARIDLELAADLEAQRVGADHPSVAAVQSLLAGVLLRRGDAPGAEALLESVLATYERAYGPHHPRIAATLGNLGLVQAGDGRFDHALEHMTRARAIFEHAFGADHPAVATAEDSIGDVLRRADRCDEAKDHFARAIATFERLGVEGPPLGAPLLGLGRCELACDAPAAARTALERAWRSVDADDVSPVQRGDTALALALALVATGDRATAQPLLDRAAADFGAALDPDDDRWTELAAARGEGSPATATHAARARTPPGSAGSP